MKQKGYHKLFGELNTTLSAHRAQGIIVSFITKKDRLGQFIEVELAEHTQPHPKRNQFADDLYKKYKKIISAMMHPIRPHKLFCIYLKSCD